MKQIAPNPDVAVKEAFGDAGAAATGADGWNTGDRGEAVRDFAPPVAWLPAGSVPGRRGYRRHLRR